MDVVLVGGSLVVVITAVGVMLVYAAASTAAYVDREMEKIQIGKERKDDNRNEKKCMEKRIGENGEKTDGDGNETGCACVSREETESGYESPCRAETVTEEYMKRLFSNGLKGIAEQFAGKEGENTWSVVPGRSAE